MMIGEFFYESSWNLILNCMTRSYSTKFRYWIALLLVVSVPIGISHWTTSEDIHSKDAISLDSNRLQ